MSTDKDSKFVTMITDSFSNKDWSNRALIEIDTLNASAVNKICMYSRLQSSVDSAVVVK